MVSVVDYIPEHLMKIDPKPSHLVGEMPEKIATQAVTLVNKRGEPIAIFGYFWIATGVMNLWGVVSEKVRDCPVAFHKICLDMLRYCQVGMKARRVQMDVLVTYREGARWARKLGFKPEGVMQAFSKNGTDCILFGRVF